MVSPAYIQCNLSVIAMPCYTAWNSYLTPNTPEYLLAEEMLRAKLKAIRHIIDYYYRANSIPLPSLPSGTIVDPCRQPRSHRELAVREAICHHYACDEIDFCTLYDAASLLDSNDKEGLAYLAVILPCATQMRTQPEKFNPYRSTINEAVDESGDS